MKICPNILKISITVFIIIIVSAYGLLKVKDLIRGPGIRLSSPANGETLTDQVIDIDGVASRISSIYLNDRQIFTDENGKFQETFLLSPGYNMVELKAYDKFNRIVKKRLELVYK